MSYMINTKYKHTHTYTHPSASGGSDTLSQTLQTIHHRHQWSVCKNTLNEKHHSTPMSVRTHTDSRVVAIDAQVFKIAVGMLLCVLRWGHAQHTPLAHTHILVAHAGLPLATQHVQLSRGDPTTVTSSLSSLSPPRADSLKHRSMQKQLHHSTLYSTRYTHHPKIPPQNTTSKHHPTHIMLLLLPMLMTILLPY